MNLKDKLVKKLTGVGKKHRILVYPTLALIAVITAVSQFVQWSRGNGKKLVASMMVLALLITQSLFLTSSADYSQTPNTATGTDASRDIDEYSGELSEESTLDMEAMDSEQPASDMDLGYSDDQPGASDDMLAMLGLTEDNETLYADPTDPNFDNTKPIIELYAVTSEGTANLAWRTNGTLTGTTVGVGTYSPVDLTGYAGYNTDYFTCESDGAGAKLYTDRELTTLAATTYNDYVEGTTYKFYYRVYRNKCDIVIKDEIVSDDKLADKTITGYSIDNPQMLIAPEVSYTVGNAATYNFYRRGYTFYGLSADGTSYEIGNSATAQAKENETSVVMTSLWTPMQDASLNLTLKVFDDNATGPCHVPSSGNAGATVTVEVPKYGDTITLPTMADVEQYCGNAGYYLTGWRVGGKTYKPGEEVAYTVENKLAVLAGDATDALNVAPAAIEGVWEYRNIDLYVNGTLVPTASGQPLVVTLNGIYGDPLEQVVISAKYKDGTTTDGSNFSYTVPDSTSDLNSVYGVTYGFMDGKPMFSSPGLREVTGSDGKTYTFTVEDSNYENVTIPCTVKLVVNPREVTIGNIMHTSGSEAPRKEYDGTDVISVKPTTNAVDSLSVDGVEVSFDSTAKLLPDVATDPSSGKNVGNNKDILLSNVHLTAANAAVLSRYVLKAAGADGNEISIGAGESATVKVSGIATVKPREIYVDMVLAQGSSDSVKFGEESPEYDVKIKDVNEIAPADLNAYDENNPQSFLKNYMGMDDPSDWETDRKYYSPVGTYYIKATFNSGAKNYDVKVSNPANFTVTRDDTLSNHVVIESPIGGYYPSYTIRPTNGYNAVRVLSGSDTDIPAGAEPAEVRGWFHPVSAESGGYSITQNGMNQTISYQLLNTNTGAISDVYTVTGINIDSQFPVYQSHTATPAGQITSLGYGSYYHSQNNVNAMSIRVVYKSEVSKCTTLHYYFTGEDANAVPSTVLSTQMTQTAPGSKMYEGTITVGSGYSGQLVIYAEDEARKTSPKTKLALNSDAALDADYYEWMTENNPSTATLTVYGDGALASANQWYNNLSAVVSAQDDESGLANLEWAVTTPAATLTYTDETPENITNATYCGKVVSATFTNTITGHSSSIGGDSASYVPGEYYIAATVKDNAGNVYAVDQQGPFKYDGNAPEVKIEDNSNSSSGYHADVEITITAADGENESGLATVELYKDVQDEAHKIRSFGNEGTYNYKIEDKGTYIVVARDVAGNSSSDSIKYDFISSERPMKPTIVADKGEGEYGNQGWFIKNKPTITINSTTETDNDKVPVTTYYKVSVTNALGKQESTSSFNTASTTFELPYEGEVTITAWAVTESDCQSDTATEVVKADMNAPVVAITDSTVDNKGLVNISFKITDLISGVDTDKVLVNGSPIAVNEVDGIVTGSFQGDGSGVYELVAYDKAGNASEPVSFEPLGLKVSPITGITSNTAHINAQVIQGTNPISPTQCYIELKSAEESSYDTVLVDKEISEDGLVMDYEFNRLIPDTVYDYRVHAQTLDGAEERVVTGSFRTLSGNDNTSIYGSVTYDKDMDDSFKTYPIYVNLYQGNIQRGGEMIDTPGASEYLFKGVADGTYRIVATNGFLTKESTVVVEKGGIAYPTNYAATNGVNFVLSGLSTSVEIDDGEVELAVDGLDKIYNTTLYKGNVTAEDLRTVQDGGSIDICLHASYIKVNDLSQTESGIFAEKLGKTAEIVRYINLYIVKTVFNADGSVKYTQNLTRLAEPITISFPLEELSGQTIYVASLHANGANYDFRNWKDAEDATVSANYVVISTDRFSTYALYRLLEKETYTVTWKDGDGNTLKTELVEAGMSATPPEGTPKKTATDKYYYVFEGWDLDYSKIDRDTVILALFNANLIKEEPEDDPNKKPGTETPGTDDPNKKPGTTTPGSNTPSTDDPNKKPGTTAPDATVKPGNTDKKEPAATKEPSTTYTYMGSVNSPKTGDAAPIVLVVSLMSMAGAGIFVLTKKREKDC